MRIILFGCCVGEGFYGLMHELPIRQSDDLYSFNRTHLKMALLTACGLEASPVKHVAAHKVIFAYNMLLVVAELLYLEAVELKYKKHLLGAQLTVNQ